jgi:hypothetical protein
MNRRGFLGLLGAAAATTAAGLQIPELFAPNRKFFLPPTGGWHSQARFSRYYEIQRDDFVYAADIQFADSRQIARVDWIGGAQYSEAALAVLSNQVEHELGYPVTIKLGPLITDDPRLLLHHSDMRQYTV